MKGYREVDRGQVTLTYVIYEYEDTGSQYRFDWRATDGTESSELFETAEEARADVIRRFS